MANSLHVHPDLTKNQSLVMGTLAKAKAPLSAYAILDQLRGDGFRAPLQVYRALDKLVEFGLVHRLESLKAFVACRHPECDAHEIVAFTICDTCGKVEEISDDVLSRRIKNLSSEAGFHSKNSTVELRGTCQACLAA